MRGALIGIVLIAFWPFEKVSAREGLQDWIEEVTLSSGGMAEVWRRVAVDNGTEFNFDVPLDQVNDVLKSLLVYDPAGGVVAMTLDGLSPVTETFRSLPFSPETMGDLPLLLQSLQGIAVRVSSGGHLVEGVVLGVEGGWNVENQGEEGVPLLSVLTEAGMIAAIPLHTDTEIDIVDTTMRENLRMAAAVSGRARIATMRTITLHLEAGQARSVQVYYVVPSPVWKTAYRLIILGDDKIAHLQAWAVLENATGEDWSDVSVTLSSGAPVMLSQRLHERYWHMRPEIPVLAQAATLPIPDRYRGREMAWEASAAQGGAPMETMRMDLSASSEDAFASTARPSAPAVRAEAGEGETAVTYRLPAPVNLPAGQTLAIPFIDTELTGERIALFQPERGEIHPIAALRLENTTETSLPPGIITVYAPQEEGYAGDAQLHGLPAGESRMISFAADRKVAVTTGIGQEEMVYRASLVDGVLRVTGLRRSTTTYTITGAKDAPRTVIIEHPRRNGWTFSSEALDSNTPTHHRLRVMLAQDGVASVEATIERTETDSFSLLSMDSAALLHWSGQIDDSETVEALTGLARQQQTISRTEAELLDIEKALDTAADRQARIRENLAAVPEESALAQRYLVSLEEQEDRIDALETRRTTTEQRLVELRDTLNKAIGAL